MKKSGLVIYHYEEARRIDPKSLAANYNLGRAYAKLSKFPQATTHFLKVVSLQPAIVEAQYGTGASQR